MKYKLYAFDFDLTLADTLAVSEKTYMAAFSAIGKTFDGDVFHHLARDRKASFAETDDGKNDYGVFLSTFEQTAESLFHEVALYPDVLDYVKKLKSSGVSTALITNRNRRSVDKALLKYLPAEELFDHIITGDVTENFKPHPEPILKCLSVSGVEKKDFVYIGDAENDMLSATRAGVDFIYVDRYGKLNKPNSVKTLFEID